MYHVNPPDIENRVKYTITTRRTRKRLCAKATSNSHKNARRSACTSGLVFPHLMGWKRSEHRFCPCRVLSSANAHQERDLMNSMYFITSARWSAERDFTCSVSGSKSGGENAFSSRPTSVSSETPRASATVLSCVGSAGGRISHFPPRTITRGVTRMPHADPAGFVFFGLSVAFIIAIRLINEVATYISVEREGRRENRILHK